MGSASYSLSDELVSCDLSDGSTMPNTLFALQSTINSSGLPSILRPGSMPVRGSSGSGGGDREGKPPVVPSILPPGPGGGGGDGGNHPID